MWRKADLLVALCEGALCGELCQRVTAQPRAHRSSNLDLNGWNGASSMQRAGGDRERDEEMSERKIKKVFVAAIQVFQTAFQTKNPFSVVSSSGGLFTPTCLGIHSVQNSRTFQLVSKRTARRRKT